MTFKLLLILIMIIAVLLILIVLVQNPKGGGLSSTIAGGSGSSIGGVQSTNNFLDKATWTLAISLLVLILISSFTISKDQFEESNLEEAATEESIQAPANNDDVNELLGEPESSEE